MSELVIGPPSIYEIYGGYLFMGEFIITIGNPDPELEESIGYEIGAEQFLFENRIHTGITYFEMKFDDLVIYDMLESRYKIAAMQKPRGLKHI